MGTGEMITHGCQWCKSISTSLGICRSTRRFTEASWHRSCAIVHLSCARGPMRLQQDTVNESQRMTDFFHFDVTGKLL